MAEGVGVAGVEDRLNRPPADPAAAQPDEGPQTGRQFPQVENLAWRERVEVADQRVEAAFPMTERPKERAQLEPAAALGPGRVHRAQVDPDDRDVGPLGSDL